jgi:hypothetical protein
MTARLHGGAVVHVWDHLVIGLRDAAGPTATLSLYAIAWSGELGGGHVALLDRRDHRRVVLADPVAVGERMLARLRAMSAPPSEDVSAIEAATFARQPATTSGALGWTIRGAATAIEARWEDLEPPVWVEGPAPAFWEREDIWACFVSARAASLTVDGRRLDGEPFPDAVWEPKIGRALSSAHAALAEVRVTPEAVAAAPGGG